MGQVWEWLKIEMTSVLRWAQASPFSAVGVFIGVTPTAYYYLHML